MLILTQSSVSDCHCSECDCFQLRDDEMPKETQESNWFSAPSALRVYGQYLNLDKDHNGMLSKAELSGCVKCCLTALIHSSTATHLENVCVLVFLCNIIDWTSSRTYS